MLLINENKIIESINNHEFKVFENGNLIEVIRGKDLSKRKKLFLLECINNAYNSHITHKHGAVVVRDNKIISSGYNHDFANTKKHGRYSKHAEVHALYSMGKGNSHEVVLYVVRIKSAKGDIVGVHNSNPCEECMQHCIKRGVVRIYAS